MANLPRITFSLTCVILFGFSFHLPKASPVAETVFESCMDAKRRGADWVMNKEDITFCRLQARRQRDRRLRLNENLVSPVTTIWDANADAKKLSLQYFEGLGAWKNGDTDIGSALLDKVAPCWKRARSQEKKWSSMYHNRRQHEVILLEALDQSWQGEKGVAIFAPLDRSINIRDLKAGEILLQRRTPADIGENFGRYSTTVYMTKTNRTEGRIHAGWQASCWSQRANTMALELDTKFIKDIWTREPWNPLQLQIKVQTRRQYLLTSRASRNYEAPVIRQVIGLVLYFTPSEEDISSHLLLAIGARPPVAEVRTWHNEHEAVDHPLSSHLLSVVAGRQRRSATGSVSRPPHYVNTRPPPTGAAGRRHDHRPRQCHRTSYRLDRGVYDSMNIRHPSHNHPLFDIGECAGDCPHPLTSANLNATNHAVVMSLGSNKDERLTVCCIPVSYENLSYTYFHDHYLRQRELTNFVATSCACR